MSAHATLLPSRCEAANLFLPYPLKIAAEKLLSPHFPNQCETTFLQSSCKAALSGWKYLPQLSRCEVALLSLPSHAMVAAVKPLFSPSPPATVAAVKPLCLLSSQLDKLLLLFTHLPLHLHHQDLLSPVCYCSTSWTSTSRCTCTRTYFPLCSCSTWWTTTSPCTCTRTISPLCSCSTRWTFPHAIALWPGPIPAK